MHLAPRFATAHLATHNRAVAGIRKSFTSLPDEFLFIDDVVELTSRLTFGNTTGVLNIVSGTSYTYAQAVDAVGVLTGVRPAVTSRARTKDRVDHRFDPAALVAACPGFRFTSMQDGLRAIAAAQPAEKART